jgi:hypothetical protein
MFTLYQRAWASTPRERVVVTQAWSSSFASAVVLTPSITAIASSARFCIKASRNSFFRIDAYWGPVGIETMLRLRLAELFALELEEAGKDIRVDAAANSREINELLPYSVSSEAISVIRATTGSPSARSSPGSFEQRRRAQFHLPGSI